MNAKENKQEIEKLRALLKRSDELDAENRAEFLAEQGVRVVEDAEWVKDESYTGSSKEIYRCSHCDHWQSVKKHQRDSLMYMKFCPFCGSRMEGADV